jgi:phospholipid N-methyltransferase
MLKNNFVFLKESIKEFELTGTVCPTSKWAADALTNPLHGPRGPKRILEIGPGTGSVTVKILADMIPGDTLMICEINPRFMEALKNNLRDNPDFIRNRSAISFFEGPVQDLPESSRYDVIVCALPFLNFDLETVQEIFGKLKRLSDGATVMTYYQYIGLRSLSLAMASPRNKQRMRELDSFFKGIYRNHLTDRRRVWLNILPINIYTLDLAA